VGAGCALTLLWAAAIVAAPSARLSRDPVGAWAGVVYLTGSLVCHQRDERSFHREAIAFPVCARCTGLYLGAPLGMFAVLIAGRSAAARAPARARWWLAAAAAPTVVSMAFEWGGGPSSLATRAFAALPLGIAVGGCVALALSEVGSPRDGRVRP
jgi:uncharacterized membrane protein